MNEKDSDDLYTLINNGGSSGGARPKYLIKRDGRHWLVKFRNTSDPKNIGEIEYQYALKAKKCGIVMPEVRLFDGKYFAAERFDIEDDKRLHVVTASGLLNADFREVSLDYIALMQLTGYLTLSSDEVEKMFRLMVFNVLIDNCDDHAKNFSFICRDGKWSLSPAYDLTPSSGFYGQHTTTINGSGKPNTNDMIAAGIKAGIKKEKCKRIIEDVKLSLVPQSL